MHFKLLGPVGLIKDEQFVACRGVRQRTLLAVLLIKAGEVVVKEQLFDELWGSGVPAGAENALQALIARLRKFISDWFDPAFTRDRLVTQPGGYLFDLEPDDLDVIVFQNLVAQSRSAMTTDPLHSRELLTRALSLWDGPALQSVRGGSVCRSAALFYGESWLSAVECKIESDIRAGDISVAIPELKKMAFLHPWREGLTEMLMVALYRAGRQAEALAAYNHIRTRLVEELGMEPSPLLQDRARAILNQDPALIAS
jgi:DNA-binding SARP family transcriptional activator